MFFELKIIRQEVEQLEDEEGVPYEKPIEDAWTNKLYSFDLREVRIFALETTKIMDESCTIVYFNNDEVVICPMTFSAFKRQIIPQYEQMINKIKVSPNLN